MKRTRTKQSGKQSEHRERYMIVTAVVEDHDSNRGQVLFQRLSESILRGERISLPQRFKMKQGKFPTLCHYSRTSSRIFFGDPDEVFRAKVSWKRGNVYILLVRTVQDHKDRRFNAVAFTTLKHFGLLVAREANADFWKREKKEGQTSCIKVT